MKIEIWGDVTCHHCYTAKQQFERALSQFPHRNRLEVVRRSFELAPGFKTDPDKLLPQFLQEMHGVSEQRVQEMVDQASKAAKGIGLEFNLQMAIPANSFNAHRLSHFAKERGLQEEMGKRLFRAYFAEGCNIDDLSTLVRLAKEIGLNEAEVRSVLRTNAFAKEVVEDTDEAKRMGISSVPAYVFSSGAKVVGAQTSDTYLEMLEKEFEKWNGTKDTKADSILGTSCEIDKSCL